MPSTKDGALPNGRVDDDALIGLVTERRNHSVNYHRNYLNRLPTYYDQYRGIYTGKVAPFRNAIHVPFLFSVVQSDVARKAQISFGGWPICSFSGYGLDDSANAKRNEVLVSAQMKDSRSFSKAVDLFLCADLYGVGIARYGWRRLKRMEKWRETADIAPGLSIEIKRETEVTRFDGPDWDVVDPLDFWPQPGKKDIDEMAWCIHRYFIDLDDLRRMAKDGYYNRAKVEEVGRAPLSGTAEAEMQGRLSVYRNYDEYSARHNEPHAKPVEVWEYWGTVPDEFVTDGVKERCVAVANGRTLLKNWPNPLWEGRKPFHAYVPMVDPHYFHGIGKIEIGSKLQQVANRLTNQKLDALDLFIDPMWVASNSSNINVANLMTRPGRIFLVDGAADDSNIRPLVPNLGGLQWSDQAVAQAWSYIQQGTGITEAIQGLSTGNRTTAREFLGRQENVMTRLMLESRLAEEVFIEPLCNSYRSLNKQYLKLPHMVKILGDRTAINPVTGLPLPPEPVLISHDDVSPDYRARAVGATQMIGKSVRQQNVMQLLQAVSSNPVLMQLVNWAAFARQMFQLFDFDNVTELLNVQNVPAINMVAEQAGMSPEMVAGAVSQPLDQLNPDLIGALIPQQGGIPQAT